MIKNCNIAFDSSSKRKIDSPFLHSYQKRTLDLDEQKPEDKVDSLRFCLVQHKFLQLDQDPNIYFQHDFSLQRNVKDLEVQYSTLFDSKEKVNSYAAPALSLSKNFLNDSSKWKGHVDLAKLEETFPKDNGENEIPDEEYLKLLKLLKETAPVVARNIKLPICNTKKEKCSQARDIPDFNIVDEDTLVTMELSNSYVPKPPYDAKSFSGIVPSVFTSENLKCRSFGMAPRPIPRLQLCGNSTTVSDDLFSKCYNKPSSSSDNAPQCIPINVAHTYNDSKEDKYLKKSDKRYPWEIIQSNDNETTELKRQNSFKTASQQLAIENYKKFESRQPVQASENLYGNQKRSLGTRRVISSKFTPPVRRNEQKYGESSNYAGQSLPERNNSCQTNSDGPYAEMMMDEIMKNIDVKMVELIMNEIMDNGPSVTWDDIAGLELAKSTIKEIVVWPMLRPDIFTGLRGPPKGLLLFGPPGTGKTMIGKCIASQSHSTFFSISASSLTSKWVGEGEKMVRAMFAVAKYHQPAVIFIDEIDSLLTQRSESEHESSRRIKTEFLVQLDGATSGDDERLLVVGATNRPQELDEAARRRLVKRLYIPLPEMKARQQIIINLLSDQNHTLTSSDVEEISTKAEGYSGADMANLCREAALGPIRSLNFDDIQHISLNEVRAISKQDFISALDAIRASVSDEDLHRYEDWNRKYGINPK